MHKALQTRRWIAGTVLAGAVAILASCQSMSPMMMMGQQVALTGAGEVPPVTTSASGLSP